MALRVRMICFYLIFLLFFSNAIAQILKLDGYNLPPDYDRTWDLLPGDFNNDGFDDFFCVNEAVQCRLYLNTGEDTDEDGILNLVDTRGLLPDSTVDNRCGAVLDMNADAIPDILIGRAGQYGTGGVKNSVLINTGQGSFYKDSFNNWKQDEAYSTQDIVVCDLDLDGDLDIITANGFVDCKVEAPSQWRKERNCIYINQGNLDMDGIFNFIDPYHDVATQSNVWSIEDNSTNIDVGDIDGNGYPDIVFSNFADMNRIYLNQGDTNSDDIPNFVDGTKILLPNLVDTDYTRDICLADFDGDLDLDLFMLNDRSQDKLYFYDQLKGYFVDVTNSNLPAMDVHDLKWESYAIDLDKDNDMDIFIAANQNRIFMNDGKGFFTDMTDSKLLEGDFSTLGVSFWDYNGDGDLDILQGNTFEQNRLQLNDGTGGFREDVTSCFAVSDADYSEDIVLVDIDLDKDLDLFAANRNHRDRLYINDGAGHYSDGSSGIPGYMNDTKSIGIGFANNDSYPDLILGIEGGALLYMNNGDGSFADSTELLPPDLPGTHFGAMFIDADMDGDQDIFLTGVFSRCRLLDNDGNGAFTDVSVQRGIPNYLRVYRRCDTGDINGDGYPEIVVANMGTSYGTLLLWNQGDGSFADSSGCLGFGNTIRQMNSDVKMADVDLDGDQDIFVGNFRSVLWPEQHYSRIYINDSTGHFVESSASMLPMDDEYPVNEVSLVDLNGDVFPEVVLANYSTTNGSNPFDVVQVYINDGGTRFIDSTDDFIRSNSESGEMNLAVDVGDIDGDGVTDVVIGTDGQTRLYLNHYYHTSVHDDYSAADIPGHFTLCQNYPNPFNPKTMITYSIHKPGHVKLIIYDIVGREVAKLIDKYQGKGNYSIAWHISEQSSGTYFYCLQTGGRKEVKKCVVLK